MTVGSGSTRIQTLVDNSFYDNASSYGFVIQDRPDLGGILEWAASPGSGVTRVRTNNSFGDNNWHHIVATNNGTTSRLYVDGVSNATSQHYLLDQHQTTLHVQKPSVSEPADNPFEPHAPLAKGLKMQRCAAV